MDIHDEQYLVNDSETSENMTQGIFALGDYEPNDRGERVECSCRKSLPVSGYG